MVCRCCSISRLRLLVDRAVVRRALLLLKLRVVSIQIASSKEKSAAQNAALFS
jgi:hypothetical protein